MMNLINKLLILSAILLFSFKVSAQAQLSGNLTQKLSEKNTDFVYINIHLSKKTDLKALTNSFKTQKLTVDDRIKSTINTLQQNAKESQKDIINYLQNNKTQVKNIETYWISNIISLYAYPEFIYQLQQRKDIELISSNDHNYFYHKPFKVAEARAKISKENAESGIYAINAPLLWEMGYTGRNTIVLGVDTGVKHKHPSISRGFLGNYRPLSETWFGYNNITPNDISFSSTHGTHTLGTVLGLEESTSDTIGIAYNAYWIASDPIVSNIADVKTLGEILKSFQFALNPDGDINTTNDVPDVITNSWGWDSFYSNEDCIAPEAEAINACAAAGIGVIFSAGNDGPGVSTIGQPSNLVSNLYNVFSVGAINGHNSDFPIADFSSRGPTTCVEESDGYSLWIKPEVVAPGVNIRSANGDNGYKNLSGTSMACPHVTGAFLLLKEAFPDLAGEEILKGLYETSVDLGETGEDNVFGKGIIDVKAAYDYLAVENTPTPPAQNDYDLALWSVNKSITSFSTNETESLEVSIRNLGNNAVNNFNLSIVVNNGNEESFSEQTNILPDSIITISIPSIALKPGRNTIKLNCNLNFNAEEADYINNTKFIYIDKPTTVSLPYVERFDTTNVLFTNTNLSISNPNDDWTWIVDTAGGLPNNTYSMRLDFTKMKKRNDEIDDLISPIINIPNSDKNISLWFNYAYAARMLALYKDSLVVCLSNNMGASWNDTLFAKADTSLSTVDFYSGNERFIPKSEDEWKKFKQNLNTYKGQQILIRFRGINDNGSNLYLDNFAIFEGDTITFVENKIAENANWYLYPNPATESVFISGKDISKSNIEVYNATGVLIKNIKALGNKIKLNTSSYKKGIYFIRVSNNYKQSTKKLIVN